MTHLDRDQLINACLQAWAREGADLSYRQMAKAVGTSARMLSYHFGNAAKLREALVERLLEQTGQEFSTQLDQGLGAALRGQWVRFRQPRLRPLLVLYHEVYMQRLRQGDRGFFRAALLSFVETLADHFGGGDHAEARARALIDAARGLLLDWLATGDTQRVGLAVEELVLWAERLEKEAKR